MERRSARGLRLARAAGAGPVALLSLCLAGRAAGQQPGRDPYDGLPAAGAPAPADEPASTAADSATPAANDAWLAGAVEHGAAGAPTGDASAAGAGPPPEAAAAPEYSGELVGETTATSSYSYSPGAKVSDDFLPPSGAVEVGGELVLVTSDYRLGPDRIELTDVGLLRLRVRRAFGEHLGLFAATHLLMKQPQSVDEPAWQGSLGGLVVPFGRWFAAELVAGGGPLLGRDGIHHELASQLLFKRPIERYLRFELGLGTATTGLVLRPRPDAPFWFEEVVTHAQAQFGDADAGGVWIGVDYRIPYAKSPSEPVWDGLARRSFDLGTTLGLSVGGVGEIEDTGWELFAILTVVDRGELDDPSTQLPILDGGFDQTQLSLGVQHRFQPPDPARRRERRLRRRGSPSGPVLLPMEAE